jgi:hypothetical protein
MNKKKEKKGGEGGGYPSGLSLKSLDQILCLTWVEN